MTIESPISFIKLLPCPCCGEKVSLIEGFDVDCESTTATIECDYCTIGIGPIYPDTIEDVRDLMNQWNMRNYDW